jgi:hypothetical protein
MSKFAKFVLICGSGMFFCGLMLALVALAMGSDSRLVRQRLEQMGVGRIGSVYWEWEAPYNAEHPKYQWDTNPLFPPDSPLLPDPSEPPGLPESPALAEAPKIGEYEIKNLSFDFSLGDVSIIAGDDFGIIYGNNNTRRHYSESISGDSWVISSNKVRWRWNFRQNDLRLTVVLPRDFMAEDMYISMGAGNMQANNLRAKKLQLEVGLGNCQIDNLSAEDANLNVGVGSLEIGHFSAKQAKLEVGLGSMDISLTQPLTQYRYHVQVGLGSVQLGNQSYNGVADVNSGADDAPYSLDISCGLGSINVRPPLTVQM